jgi:hypothetical protein
MRYIFRQSLKTADGICIADEVAKPVLLAGFREYELLPKPQVEKPDAIFTIHLPKTYCTFHKSIGEPQIGISKA